MDEPAAMIISAGQDALAAPVRPLADTRPYWVYLASLGSAESRRTMQGCLDRIAAMFGVQGDEFPWHEIRYDHAAVIRAKITGNDGWSPSHMNKHLSALRGILKQCWKLGLMTAEEYERARSIPEASGHREPAGRSIHIDEMAALLAACQADENTPLGLRDAALLAALYSTGLRRAEAAAALIERYDQRERSLQIIGKGNKQRTVYVMPDAAAVIGRWLAVIGSRRGPLFRPVDRWGNIAPRHMSARAVGMAVSVRRTEAGLPPLSTHDFRHTFGGDFLDAGGDVVQLQRLFGHASATTTAGYDRRPGRALRAAVDRLHLPSPADRGAR